MKLRGQKWVFQDGNHEIIVENAWSWSMFSQERIQINGETVFARSGALDVAWKWTEAHKEAWLTQLGDETLSVQYISGFMKVHACLLYTSPSPRDLSTSRMPSSA